MLAPTKITNAQPGSFIAPEYSSVCAFPKDNAYLLLLAQDHFQLFTGTGKFLRDLPIGASERPRWSRHNAGQLTYIRGNQLVIYDVGVADILDSYIFTEYVALDDYGEADQQGDNRVLVGTRPDWSKDFFVLNVVTGAKGPVLAANGTLNNVLLCPDGEILLDGQLLINPVTKLARIIAGSDSHKAVGRDLDGKAILVRDNSNDPVNPENKHRIMKVPIDGSEPTVLLELHWDTATHTSLCDKFALVTTKDEILKVALDGSGSEVLCRHGSDGSTYTGQPKATVSADGSRFVFASNGGDPNGPVDTWLGVLAVPEPPPPPPIVWPGPPYPGEVPRVGFWGRIWAMLRRLFGGRA